MSVQFKNLATAAATAVFLFMGQQAVAQQRGACSDPSWGLCGEWEVGARALYFTPITCPFSYASVQTFVFGPDTISTGQAQVIPCRPEWGFRVFGNYLHDCFFAKVSYQWFEVTTTRSIVAPSVRIAGSAGSAAGKATGQEAMEYQNVDVRVGRYLLRGCRSSLYLYGNGRWVDLSHRRSARNTFINTNGEFVEVQEKSQLEGGALGIGFGGEVDIWCNFGAFIDGNLLGVIGRRSIKDVRFRGQTPTILQIRRQFYPSETCVIPEVDFRIGLNYTYTCGCWALVGEVGYEVDHFWDASAMPELTSSGVPQSLTGEFMPACQDLGFSGLFFGARLVF